MNQRKSNFELLRIVAMFCILMGHYVGKGGIVSTSPSLAQFFSLFFWGGGKLGVNCFVLLTGYFAESVSKLGEKVVDTWCKVGFYAWLSFALYAVFCPANISVSMLKQTVFPVATQVYWFASDYILLCLLRPFINVCLLRLDKKQYQKLLIILLSVSSVITTVIYNITPFFSNIGWFVCLYCIGYFVRKYLPPPNHAKSTSHLLH